jgi:hypothetical protein
MPVVERASYTSVSVSKEYGEMARVGPRRSGRYLADRAMPIIEKIAP